MKKLISIYVSVFLIFSSLYGQTQNMPLRLEGKFVLRLRTGALIRATFLNEIKKDSLIFDYNGGMRSINLNSITEIKIIKENKIKTGLLIGGGVMALIPLALIIPFEFHGQEGRKAVFAILAVISIGSGMILGSVTGAILGMDKVHNLSNLSLSDKISLIQGLIDIQNN